MRLVDDDFTFEKQAEYLDKLFHDLIKEGMAIQEIMNMPYSYILDILEEKQKPKKEKSLISAFSG